MYEQGTPEVQVLDEQSPPPGGSEAPAGTPQIPSDVSRPRRYHGRGNWMVALVIIVVGIVFLIKNTGWLGHDWDFQNWWALFILIPTFGSLADAWSAYNGNGRRLNGKAARSLGFGLLLLAITVIFLLKLDWGKVWPVLLIIVGLGMILSWRKD